MKKIKSLFLCLVLSTVCVFAGCNQAINDSVKETAASNYKTIIGSVAAPSLDKEALAEITDEDYKIKEDEFEAANIKFASKDVYANALKSCAAAEDEAGSLEIYAANNEIQISGNEEDGYKVSARLGFSDRQVDMNIAYEPDMTITDITFSPVYSIGEAMTKAALNTLLGMGSVFCVLILIMFIIYLFGIIPKIQKSIDAKKAAKNDNITEKSVDKTIANIVEKEEGELVDDYELVAVISAAIAAYEGNGSTDGFVVRSIKKSQSKKWQNAQY